jgi:hypothetical protein
LLRCVRLGWRGILNGLYLKYEDPTVADSAATSAPVGRKWTSMKVLDRFRHPGWPRRLLFVSGLAVALVILLRILLDPLAAHVTRRLLNEPEAVSGNFQKVHVSLFPPAYEIRRLKIIEARDGDGRHPLFYAESTKIIFECRRIWHAEFVASLRLDDLKIVVTARPAKAPKQGLAMAKIPILGDALEGLLPAWVDKVEVHEGELLFRDPTAPHHPQIWLHHIELSAENVSTRTRPSRVPLSTVRVHAMLGHSGAFTFVGSADLFATKPQFAGDLAVRGWNVAELYALEESAMKLQTPKGTMDIFAKFKAQSGVISGWVKPVLKNVEVRPTEAGFGNGLKAWVVDRGLHLFSDSVPEGNVFATIIPIEGRLDRLDAQPWPTIMGVVRNAFVEGITTGFGHPPRQPENGKK